MNTRRRYDELGFLPTFSEPPQNPRCMLGHATRVAPSVRIAQVDGVRHTLEHLHRGLLYLSSVLEGSIHDCSGQHKERQRPWERDSEEDREEPEDILAALRNADIGDE